MEPKALESFLSDIEYLREAEALLKKIYYLCHDGEDVDGYIDDLEIENGELENRVDELGCAFDNLKNDSLEGLNVIKSELESIIESNKLDSVTDKLKELKKVVENQHRIVADADDF